jgi:membrane protein required for colicin V production
MTWLDLSIVGVLVISVISAFFKGLMVELFSLAGVVLGLWIAAADYERLALWLISWVKNPQVANLVAFLLIALGVMLLAGLVGRLLRGTVRWVGLGFVDRFLGALFGFVKGCAVITLGVMAVAAFLPHSDLLRNSRLAQVFLTGAHSGSHMTPFEFGEKIREGVKLLRIPING